MIKKAARILLIVSVLAGVAGYCGVEVPDREEIEEIPEIQEKGVVPYQSVFEQYAPAIGWEWQMLAAVAYHESRFNPSACSYAGARGLMQLMPITAGRFGLNDSTVWEPEDNIRAGVEYIQYLQGQWAFIANTDEQNNFVLASYNVGPATIMGARKNAMEEGAEGNMWSQVEPYVKSGATRAYVKNVLKTTNKYRNDTSKR